MRFSEVVRRRRMVRSFLGEPVEPSVIDALCDLARRAPSAGMAQALDFLVLDEPESLARYWDLTLPEPRRAGFRWQGLLVAPVLVVVVVDPDAYVDRYSETDKSHTGLGEGQDAWSVPFWWVDAGAAIEHILLGAVEQGLGACLFGLFDHEGLVAGHFGVPAGRRLVATIAIGHPDATSDAPGRSAGRARRELDDVVRRGHWETGRDRWDGALPGD